MFTFIEQIEGVEFAEALRILADKAGVTLRRIDPSQASERAKLYDVCEAAARYFANELETTAHGRIALEYLEGRGVASETRSTFRLGFAPARWDGLARALRASGFLDQDVAKAGLTLLARSADGSGQGRYYDRFRSRIVFPIFDLSGKVVGFSGRFFTAAGLPAVEKAGTEPAKYINTPQTPIYDKGKILYGLDKAKLAIRKEDRAVLVEGNMDALMSHQAGVVATVATSGTALTSHHLQLLKRYSENVVIAFDADAAGAQATRRGVDLAHSTGIHVRIASTAGAKDPADLARDDVEAWRKAVAEAKPILEFFFRRATEQFPVSTAEGKKAIGREFLPLLALTTNRIEQAHWVQELSRVLSVREEAVWAELAKTKPGEVVTLAEVDLTAKAGARSRFDRLEEEVLAGAFALPTRQTLLANVDNPCSRGPARVVFAVLQQASEETLSGDGWRKQVDAEYHRFVENILWFAETLPEDPRQRAALVESGLRQLTELKTRVELETLAAEIKAAEQSGERDRLEELLRRFQDVSAHLAVQPKPKTI